MGRGGTRWGAGRPAAHGKIEHCLRLDVRKLACRHLLEGAWFTWQWSDSDTKEVRGTIGVKTDGRTVRLNYTVDGKPTEQTIALSKTACTYGGSRPWFLCPVGGERVAVLYMRAGRFACRHCQRLAYGSQSDDEIGRMWRKQSKIENRLGTNWRKPKGMHEATHQRLRSAIIDLEMRREDVLEFEMERMLGPNWRKRRW